MNVCYVAKIYHGLNSGEILSSALLCHDDSYHDCGFSLKKRVKRELMAIMMLG